MLGLDRSMRVQKSQGVVKKILVQDVRSVTLRGSQKSYFFAENEKAMAVVESSSGIQLHFSRVHAVQPPPRKARKSRHGGT